MAENALQFQIDFSGSGDQLLGRLQLRELDGSLTTRLLPGTRCDDLVAAMALIAAVLIDPEALTSEVPPRVREPTLPVLERPLSRPTVAKSKPSDPSAWGLELGSGGVLETVVAPRPVPGVAFEASAQRKLGPITPALGLALEYTLPSRTTVGNNTARFDWAAARVLASPSSWPVAGWGAFRPWLLFDLGRLEGSGENTSNRATVRVPWLALGALGRFELRPVQALLVFMDAGVIVPLRRDRFYFDPEDPGRPSISLPGIGLVGRLGVAVHFE